MKLTWRKSSRLLNRVAFLVFIISGGYTRCDFYCILSTAMICLLSKNFTCVDDTFLVHNESHNNRNLFVDWWVARFISLIFLSTSVALNILLSLYQLFCDFENFISLFDRFRFWVPTRFPEVIRPRYDPDWPNLQQYIAKKFFLQHY